MTAEENLSLIRAAIERMDDVLHLDANLKLTKTREEPTKAILIRDSSLERSVGHWMEDRLGTRRPGTTPAYAQLIASYLQYDRANLHSIAWPEHFPARIVAGHGSICSGSNVFVFFPEALGLTAATSDDTFGIEFIDVWANAFTNAIAPCLRRIFDIESQLFLFQTLAGKFEQSAFLASLFHEIGHRVGPLRVSPAKDPQNHLSRFNLDTLGELSTDSLLTTNLHMFPEVVLYIVLTRIFWYARQGFGDAPQTGRIHVDNDAWTGAYLWRRFEACGAIKRSPLGGSWHLRYDTLVETLRSVRQEVHDVASEALREEDPAHQNQIVERWLSNQLGKNQAGEFRLPDTLIEAFQLCQGIPEKPVFSPPVVMPLHYSETASSKGPPSSRSERKNSKGVAHSEGVSIVVGNRTVMLEVPHYVHSIIM